MAESHSPLRVVEETSRGADGLAIPRDRVALLTDGGIEQFIFQDADSVAFVDPELQKKVGTALSRLASHRSDGRRLNTGNIDAKPCPGAISRN